MYRLIQSSGFDRAFRRFARRHSELRERVAATFRLLSENPFEPSLRLHALTGNLAGLHAVSITYFYRITLILRIVESEVELVNIGSHDEVYG